MPQPHHHHCAGCNTPVGHRSLPPRPTEHAPICDLCLADGATVAWDSVTVRAYRAAGQTVTWYAGDVIDEGAPNPLAPCLCPAALLRPPTRRNAKYPEASRKRQNDGQPITHTLPASERGAES